MLDLLGLTLIASAIITGAPQESDGIPDPALLGHSSHGEAFDKGPRQKPWKIEGIGHSHFPITTSVPEVQEWFDQGNTLLHSFWWFEAERAFRWCLKLDPECAMAYWGLARAVRRGDTETESRSGEFLQEALKRRDQVTERERRYLDVWDEVFSPKLDGSKPRRREMGNRELADKLEMVILEDPDDREAKSLFVLASLFGSSRYGNELILQEILAAEPQHPGAHHYRIHNWDGPEGAEALHSCEVYGELAWYSGHANHMPGHIYSGIGMWHEGAIWMDSATRVEKTYMRKRMTLPIHNWNYAHNRNYLAYTQEQLGLPSLALQGAEDLLAAPLDPDYNNPNKPGYCVYREGLSSMIRTLVKFERWETILDEKTLPWRDTLQDKVWRAYCESLALLETGDLDESRKRFLELKGYEKEVSDEKQSRLKSYYDIQVVELEALLTLADGEDLLGGLRLLTEAAELESKLKERDNDPPDFPRALFNLVGETYLDQESYGLAIAAFERVMEDVPNDAFALSGLARAHHALGQTEEANNAYGRLLYVWSEAEPGLRWMDQLASLGLESAPIDESAKEQRNYRTETLATLGPGTWKPYDAPRLEAQDSQGQIVTLEQYRGKNVLLVFYLGEECPHCVDQLKAIQEKEFEFAETSTEILAISSDTPEQNASSEELGELAFRLLSDVDHSNARRFHSYDDFEELELHSTILVDAEGKLHWSRNGGDPFMDLDFLLDEIRRLNESSPALQEVNAGS